MAVRNRVAPVVPSLRPLSASRSNVVFRRHSSLSGPQLLVRSRGHGGRCVRPEGTRLVEGPEAVLRASLLPGHTQLGPLVDL